MRLLWTYLGSCHRVLHDHGPHVPFLHLGLVLVRLVLYVRAIVVHSYQCHSFLCDLISQDRAVSGQSSTLAASFLHPSIDGFLSYDISTFCGAGAGLDDGHGLYDARP